MRMERTATEILRYTIRLNGRPILVQLPPVSLWAKPLQDLFSTEKGRGDGGRAAAVSALADRTTQNLYAAGLGQQAHDGYACDAARSSGAWLCRQRNRPAGRLATASAHHVSGPQILQPAVVSHARGAPWLRLASARDGLVGHNTKAELPPDCRWPKCLLLGTCRESSKRTTDAHEQSCWPPTPCDSSAWAAPRATERYW